MAPRRHRRQRSQYYYSEDSDDSVYKKRRINKKNETKESEDVEKTPEYKEALEALQKDKDSSLLLIQTELRMRLENANTLATFEEKRVEQFFNDQISILQKHISDEKKSKIKSTEDEGRHTRSFTHSLGQYNHYATMSAAAMKKDACVFNVSLPENDIANDLLFMSNSTSSLYKKQNLPVTTIVAPLSHNRLLLNNNIIYPGTPCALYSRGVKLYDCHFVSTIVKEKENKDKKREPEFVLRVSATRKRRLPIESLRNGLLSLEFKEEDLKQMKDTELQDIKHQSLEEHNNSKEHHVDDDEYYDI